MGGLYIRISKLFYGTGISKISIIRETHKKLVEKTHPEFISVFGYTMFLDPKDQSGHSVSLDQETEEMKILKKIIKKGDVVIDIGANIGFYTLFFRSLVGDEGKIFSFEPIPSNFELLQKNVKINNFKNIFVFQKAVGNENSKVMMNISEDIGQSRVSATKSQNDIMVECIRLDDHVKFANFIKIDTEGYEIEVLKGMEELLDTEINIMSEFYVKLLKAHSNPTQFFHILKDKKFTFFDMRENMAEIDETTFSKKYNENSGATDILCKKKSINSNC